MSDNVTPVNDVDEVEAPGVIAYMFSNDKDGADRLLSFLRMFYEGVYRNTVGIMEAKNKDTGELELVLVGIDHSDDGMTDTFPIAKILNANDAVRYLAPDSEGGWLGNDELLELASELPN